MGSVFVAEDTLVGTPVAIKIIHRRLSAGAEAKAIALDELRMARRASHPNLCRLYDAGVCELEGETYLFLSMELLRGETLAERLGRKPGLSLPDAGAIAERIVAAVEALHAAGVVHGDLKPANVMLARDDSGPRVVVTDFGLARPAAAPGDTPSPELAATPEYMPPELGTGGSASPAGDVYSLGLVIAQLITGLEIHSVADSPDAGGPVPLSFAAHAALRHAKGDWLRVVERCLQADPAKRYASAAELRAVLDRGKPSAARPKNRSMWPRLLAAVAVALAIVTGVYLQLGGRSQGPPIRAVPLTTFTGEQNFPAFSPDGEKVAFCWVGPPRQDGRPAMNIYVKSILAGETVRLTGGPTDDRFPSWSPDGSQIAFYRFMSATLNLALMVVPSGGGAERKVADIGVGHAWSPDGSEIAYVAPYAPAGNGGIVVRSLKTGGIRQLTNPQPQWERMVAWSPDGRQIAFTRIIRGGSVRELFVIPSQGGEARQLTFDNQTMGGVAWTPDSRELVFDSSRKTGGGLWRIRAAGGTPEPIAYTASHPAFPSVSLRGNRLVYADFFIDSNIWQYEFAGPASGAGPLVQRPKCLICSTVEDDSPRYSPDGRKIVFVSRRTGSEDLWTANSDGSSPAQLTFMGGPTGSPRWSPDGRWIAFDSRAAGSPDVYVVSAAGGAPRRLTPEPSLEIEPSWSHDGQWIYFASDRGGQSHIWKAPFAGGPALQVTQGDGGESLESPDGKRLYYFRREHNDGIWSLPVDGGLEEVVPELSGIRRTRAWTVRAEGIYFHDLSSGQPLVRFFNFATRQVTTLLTAERQTLSGSPGLDISPDGRRLLFTQVDHRMDGLMMIENFR